jgi:hypothetical protein
MIKVKLYISIVLFGLFLVPCFALAMFGYGAPMMGGLGMGGMGMMGGYGAYGAVGSYGAYGGVPGYGVMGNPLGLAGSYPVGYGVVTGVPQTVNNLSNGPLTNGSATPSGQNNIYAPNGWDNYSRTIAPGGSQETKTGENKVTPIDALNNNSRAPDRTGVVYGGTASGATSAH